MLSKGLEGRSIVVGAVCWSAFSAPQTRSKHIGVGRGSNFVHTVRAVCMVQDWTPYYRGHFFQLYVAVGEQGRGEAR